MNTAKTAKLPSGKGKRKGRFSGTPITMRLEPDVRKLLHQCVKISGCDQAEVLRTAIGDFLGKHKTKEEVRAAVQRHKDTFATTE